MNNRFRLFLITLLSVFCFVLPSAAKEEGTRVQEKVAEGTVMILKNSSSFKSVQTNDGGHIEYTGMGQGTGFFINDHMIVTNHHVISRNYAAFMVHYQSLPEQEKEAFYAANFDAFWFYDESGMTVDICYDPSTNDIVTGTIRKDWPELDLAIIEIDPKNCKRTPLSLSNGDHIENGMETYVIGFPYVLQGDIIRQNDPGITKGIISKIDNAQTGYINKRSTYTQLAIDADVNSGNDGSPITDRHGNVIGIVTSSATQGVAYFGVHVDELTTKLDHDKYSYKKAFFIPTWACIAGAAVLLGGAAAAIVITRKRREQEKVYVSSQPVTVTPPTPITVVQPTQPGEQKPIVSVNTVQAQKATLQGFSGSFKGEAENLSMEEDCIIGKSPDCTIQLRNDYVSGRHCRIHYSRSNRCYIVQDLGSKNGTIIVRGEKSKKVPTHTGIRLYDGDRLFIPDKRNEFRVNIK